MCVSLVITGDGGGAGGVSSINWFCSHEQHASFVQQVLPCNAFMVNVKMLIIPAIINAIIASFISAIL